jgi:hypothetical protein
MRYVAMPSFTPKTETVYTDSTLSITLLPSTSGVTVVVPVRTHFKNNTNDASLSSSRSSQQEVKKVVCVGATCSIMRVLIWNVLLLPSQKARAAAPLQRFLDGSFMAALAHFMLREDSDCPMFFYCVKCFHSENVLDEATPPIRFSPPVSPIPVQQQHQQISNERRQSPNNRQHTFCSSAIHSTMVSSPIVHATCCCSS